MNMSNFVVVSVLILFSYCFISDYCSEYDKRSSLRTSPERRQVDLWVDLPRQLIKLTIVQLKYRKIVASALYLE
jgi:hypothetical protein